MVVQTPEIKIRELRYFKFQLKMMNIAKNDITIQCKSSQETGQQRTSSKNRQQKDLCIFVNYSTENVTALTVTDSLSLRFRKLVPYFRAKGCPSFKSPCALIGLERSARGRGQGGGKNITIFIFDIQFFPNIH